MAIARQFATSVGTSAGAIEGTQYPGFLLINNGGETVFIGDSAVTTSTGFPVKSGEVFSPSEMAHKSFTGKDSDRLYGRVAASTEDVRVLLMARVNV